MFKNILITGGAGYIGSHVGELLLKKNKKVFLLDNLTTGHRKLINKKAKFFKIDINNKNKVKKIINKYKIDSIIHLAANLIISEGQRKPKKYYKNNVLGTKKLLDACKKTTVKNFIFSSTAAIYKEGQYKVSENSKIKPKSVYGKTKVEAEKLIKKALKRDPESAAIIDSYGWVLYRLGKNKRALKELQRAYAKLKNPEVAYHIVEVLRKLEQQEEALKVLKEAQLLNPNSKLLKEVRESMLSEDR